MAEVGKVVVQIEARIGALESGLAQAELAIRQSGDKMVAAQDSLSKKFSRSWVEISSKVAIYSQALDIVSKSVSAITKFGAMMDESLTLEESIVAAQKFDKAITNLPLGIGSAYTAFKQLAEATGLWEDALKGAVQQQERVLELTRQQEALKAIRMGVTGDIRLMRLRIELLKTENKLEATANIEKERAEIKAEAAMVGVRKRQEEYANALKSERPEDIPARMDVFNWFSTAEEYDEAVAKRVREQKDWDRMQEIAPVVAAQRAEAERMNIEKRYNLEIEFINEALRQGLLRKKEAEDLLKALEAQTAEREKQAKLDKRRSELEKLIDKEKKRLAGRPDVATGSIQTALGSFTIAMPEGERIQKDQLELLNELERLLDLVLREIKRGNRQVAGNTGLILAA